MVQTVHILGFLHEDKAKQNDKNHGEEDSTIEHILAETELSNQLK